MDSIVITLDDEQELELLQTLIKRLGHEAVTVKGKDLTKKLKVKSDNHPKQSKTSLPILEEGNAKEGERIFDKVLGIWNDRDMDIQEYRRQLWQKK